MLAALLAASAFAGVFHRGDYFGFLSVPESWTADTTAEHAFAFSATIPSGTWAAGRFIAIEANGSGSALPQGGTLTFRVRYNGTLLFASQAYAQDNSVWYLNADARCIVTGASGALYIQARNGVGPGSGSFVGSSGTSQQITGVDLTGDGVVTWSAQFSASGVGQNVTLGDARVQYKW